MGLSIIPDDGGTMITLANIAVPEIELAPVEASASLTFTGVSGPRGPKGEQGPAGPAGGITGEDFPDFTLIFENKLI